MLLLLSLESSFTFASSYRVYFSFSEQDSIKTKIKSYYVSFMVLTT